MGHRRPALDLREVIERTVIEALTPPRVLLASEADKGVAGYKGRQPSLIAS